MKIKNIDKNKLIKETASINKILSRCRNKDILDGEGIAIIKSEYNKLITNSIRNGIVYELIKLGMKHNEIMIPRSIPGGAFELPLMTRNLLRGWNYNPVVIVVGCIIKGETKHHEYLSASVMNAIRNVSFETNVVIVNGILTTETVEQAVARAGKELNKGREFAKTAFDLMNYNKHE